jgi:WD40 repeat protein
MSEDISTFEPATSSPDDGPQIFAVQKDLTGGWTFNRRDFLVAAAAATAAASSLAACGSGEDKNPCPGAQAHSGRIHTLALTADCASLVSSSELASEQIKQWSLPDGALLGGLEKSSNAIVSLAITTDDSAVLVGHEDGTIRLLPLQPSPISGSSGVTETDGPVEDVAAWDEAPAEEETMEEAPEEAVAEEAAAETVARDGVESEHQPKPEYHYAPLPLRDAHAGAVRALALASDGSLLVSGGADQTVRVWMLRWVLNRPAVALSGELKGHTGVIKALAISPDGTLLASGSDDKTIRLWSLPDGDLINTLEGHDEAVNALSITPDGTLLVSGGADKRVKLWSLPGGELVKDEKTHGEAVNALAISPDGTLLASGSDDKTINLWELPEGKKTKSLKGNVDKVTALAVSLDGSLLISGGDEGIMRLWSLPDGKLDRCPIDLSASYDNTQGIRANFSGRTIVLPCDSEIPAGAVCTCNCVSGARCSCDSACSCDGKCSCNSRSSGGGGHYWHPN